MTTATLTTATLPIDAIEVVDRHRRDLGDLGSLAESIRTVGLLHPVVVTPAWRLVAGQRRLEACRQLGWTEIPASTVETLDSALGLLKAERDENVCRLDMKPSEKVALGLVLEPLEHANAAQRKGGRPSKTEENFSSVSEPSDGSTGKVYDLVGEAVGMSGPTYKRAKAVVADATDESLPPDQREAAQQAAARMDATGKVTPAYDAVKKARDAQPTADPSTNGHVSHEFANERERQRAQSAKTRVERAVGACNALARGADGLSIEQALRVTTREEAAGWDSAFTDALAAIQRLRKRARSST
jgi:ParB family chromosome partitioning protein